MRATWGDLDGSSEAVTGPGKRGDPRGKKRMKQTYCNAMLPTMSRSLRTKMSLLDTCIGRGGGVYVHVIAAQGI